jgi:membrane AbrB-like protein
MIPAAHPPNRLQALFLGLILSLVGGCIFALCHIPLPWMLGPLTFTGIAGVSGLPVAAIKGGRQTGQLLIGCILGQYFSPEVSRQIFSLWWVMIGSAFLALGAGGVGGLILARISGLEQRTAFFCTVAGGAAEMAVLAERTGARFDRVALAQSLRVFIVVCTIPLIITVSGMTGTDLYTPAGKEILASGLALLLVLAVATGFILDRARIPNAYILGPLLISALLTMNGVVLSALPSLFSISGQLLMGWALGSRFQPELRQASPAFLAGVVAGTLASMSLLLLVGAAIGIWQGIPLPTMALATAPGGISEMCITAKIFKLGVPMVTAFQVSRLAILLLTALPVYRGISRFKTCRASR